MQPKLRKNPKKYLLGVNKKEDLNNICMCVCVYVSRQNDADHPICGCRVALGTTKKHSKERETSFLKNILTSVALLFLG